MKKVFFCLLATSSWSAMATPSIGTNQAAAVVLGQSSFTVSSSNTGANRMYAPRGVAVDPTTGMVFVADRTNNRVLRFSSVAAMSSGAAAQIALGQPDLNSTADSSATQFNLSKPSGLAFDSQGRLYVADTGHNRVLRFNTPSAVTTMSGAAADGVLGQGSFTSNNATLLQSGMNQPSAVAVASSSGGDYLWVADYGYNRVLLFTNAENLNAGANAAKVLGQANFTSNGAANPPTEKTMSSPGGLAYSAATNILWVADSFNNRLLRFSNATNILNGAAADAVLGQAGFFTKTAPNSASPANLYSPEGIALDESGATASLWVADRVQNRVVRFDDVNGLIANGASATVVLGQSSLSGSTYHTTRNGMNWPYAVSVDTFHTAVSPRTIWVADSENSRALRFNAQEPPIVLPAPPTLGGATSYKTKKSSTVVHGSASAGAGISSVTYKGPKGGYKSAGGASWSFKAKVKPGKNRFTVIAYDTLGRASAPLTIIVKRL